MILLYILWLPTGLGVWIFNDYLSLMKFSLLNISFMIIHCLLIFNRSLVSMLLLSFGVLLVNVSLELLYLLIICIEYFELMFDWSLTSLLLRWIHILSYTLVWSGIIEFIKAPIFSKKIEELLQLSQNTKISIHGMAEKIWLKAGLIVWSWY